MGFASDTAGRARRAAKLALEEIGRRAVADIKDDIGIPVEYIGGLVIRSDPGEPPRRQYRKLQKSVKYRVEPKAATIEDLTIYTRSRVAWWMEHGTFNIEPRPFWEPARRRIGRYAPELFRKLFKEYLRNS